MFEGALSPLWHPYATGGGGEMVSLFRAIGDAELAVIQQTARVPASLSGLEVKYFSAPAEGAASYAKQAVRGFGDAPYTLVETQISRSVLLREVLLLVDRNVPAVILPNSYLPQLSPVSIWNSNAHSEVTPMVPDFSQPAFEFACLCSIRLRPAGEPGRLGGISSDYRCQLRYLDESEGTWGVDVRVYFVGQECAGPGDSVAVVIAFLDWEQESERCRVGAEFELREGTTATASGMVQSIAKRGQQKE